MTLQSSGSISLNEIHIEGGGSSGTATNINDADIRNLIFKTAGVTSSFDQFYGAGRVGSLFQLETITVSDYISSGETFTVPAGAYCWSDNTSTPAMIVDIPCTINNSGYIIGAGGAGGSVSSIAGGNGGIAISITTGGSVIINNLSGAFIAGGGGGGGACKGSITSGGGGGAGGGAGGAGSSIASEAGGAIGQTGSTASGTSAAGSGGAGGSSGGGRQLPGTGGDYVAPFTGLSPSGIGQGGDAGNAGNTGGIGSNSSYATVFIGGGGGGWGAAGGSVASGGPQSLQAAAGGSGGAAISGTHTLNNSGTIYGTT